MMILMTSQILKSILNYVDESRHLSEGFRTAHTSVCSLGLFHHPFSFLSQGANKMVEKLRESDDEFDPDDATSTDDEETIAQEETLDSGDAAKNKDREKEEIDALKRESEIPLEDLLDDLPPEYFENLVAK
jgi:hypothetical protein